MLESFEPMRSVRRRKGADPGVVIVIAVLAAALVLVALAFTLPLLWESMIDILSGVS